MTAYYECERQILGGILNYGVDDEDCKKALEELEINDFQFTPYGDLFAELKKQYKDTGNIDVVQALKNCPMEDERFFEIKSSCVTTANMTSNINELKDRSYRKRISDGLYKIIYLENTSDMLSALNEFTDAENKRCNDTDDAIKVHQKQYQEFIKEIYTPFSRKERIWTGFTSLDSCLCGLRKGSISMIGARPSTGKTTFALNIASQQLKNNAKTLIFSLEMSANQIFERLMANILDIPYGLFNNRNLEQKHKERITAYMNKTLNDDTLLIRDDIYNIEDIIREIAKFKPDLVIIDFVNLIHTTHKTNSRREEIDYISAQIKQTAKRYNCHIMTMSQLARASKDAKDKPPSMSDLKESGALEQDNDYIMILHRPYVINKSKYDPAETSLIIDKNKYGRAKIVDFDFDGAFQRFKEICPAIKK